ncbi:EamA family transporter RarD [Aurantiacibacter poecillastricola]|uniref:EamA family transporter RarD n=1 Tax=Aurantiacibacter poecillastricola TaxID=3064385 RepID=UPI00273E819D|nr:EamA family transporter RarD [Aurantiacibacter sp. 219JJ12-13]MDP5261500.1 EamA family transporter RarD [Aurantiacibacter sp. 219JJ12-13]
MGDHPTSHRRALLYALCTHAIWGSMPIYLMLVDQVPPLEYVAWRTLFTLPICLFFVVRHGQLVEFRRTMTNGRTVRTLMASSCLIAINWFFYVWSIQNEYVYAASLGYYILPLNMMLLGFVFLKERLTRSQAIAVILAAIGVAALAMGALTTMWVSLVLATTFGIYGLLRKTVAAGPLIGLTAESLILLPLVLGYLGWTQLAGGGVALGRDGLETLAIIAGGPMTAVPLLLFATAARALPYTTIGFLQFISPTIVFLIGLFVFGEELRTAQLVCFALIWAAIALFTWDMLRSARNARKAKLGRGVAPQ